MGSKFADHFSSVAPRYAEFRPAYPRELFQWIGSLVRERQSVWDCATGNGQAAVGLAQFFDTVEATDGSAGQIANATPHARVKYSVAPAEASGLAAESVDVVTVAQAAHWFDLDRFYAEAKRVLRPGGAVVFWCYGLMEFQDERLQQITTEFYRDIVGPYWPPERRLVEERYRTIPFAFAEIVAPDFQIDAEFTFQRFVGYLRTWSATQKYIEAKGVDPVRELEERLIQFWPKAESSPKGRWPIYLRAGRTHL